MGTILPQIQLTSLPLSEPSPSPPWRDSHHIPLSIAVADIIITISIMRREAFKTAVFTTVITWSSGWVSSSSSSVWKRGWFSGQGSTNALKVGARWLLSCNYYTYLIFPTTLNLQHFHAQVRTSVWSKTFFVVLTVLHSVKQPWVYVYKNRGVLICTAKYIYNLEHLSAEARSADG